MIIYGIQTKTITKYISVIIYILLYFSYTTKNKTMKYRLNQLIALLFGPIWAVGICGFLINRFFAKEMHKRDKPSKYMIIFSDIFGHILPIILITLYAPKKTNIRLYQVIIFIISFYLIFHKHLYTTYIGVPTFILFGLPPIISIIVFYLKYYYNINE